MARVGATPSPARGSPGTGCLRGGTQPWTLTDMTFLKFVAIYVSSSRSFCTLPNFASPPLLRRPPSLYLLFRFDFSAGLVPLLSRFARLWPTSLSPSLSPSFSSPLPPVHASRLARRFYFSLSIRANPVSPVPPPKGGSSSFHPARSCFYFLSAFLPPLFRPRTTAAPLSLVVLASSSKLNALSKSILSTVPGYVFGFNFDSSKENSPSFRNFTCLECSIGV